MIVCVKIFILLRKPFANLNLLVSLLTQTETGERVYEPKLATLQQKYVTTSEYLATTDGADAATQSVV